MHGADLDLGIALFQRLAAAKPDDVDGAQLGSLCRIRTGRVGRRPHIEPAVDVRWRHNDCLSMLPEMTVRVSWRELYAAGAFAQRELASESSFRSASQERGVFLGIGHAHLQELDARRALRPIAFARRGYFSGFTVPAEDPEYLRFVDETDPQPWSAYEWYSELEPQYPNVSPLYSGWQLHSLDALPDGADEVWQPVVKVLVALQNRYWPEITGRTRVLGDAKSGWVTAGPPPEDFDACATLDLLGVTPEQLLLLYHHLVESGLDRDPQDGLTLLRRARPRAFHLRWRGLPLRAQDWFDAAELVRRYLLELTGEQPPPPEAWPLDGRQQERAALYERGPGAPWSADDLKQELLGTELYPHGVHVIGEGPSEQIMLEAIVTALVGPRLLGEIGFYDLGGSGAAAHVEPLSRALGDYAVRCVVIVDREGQMAEYLQTAIENGRLDREDVCLFDDSLEASNASSAELIEVARSIGRDIPPGEEPVEFDLTPEELDAHHADRVARLPRNAPAGKADSLIILVRRETDGRLEIDKLDFVRRLAAAIAEEIVAADEAAFAEIRRRRPLVGFVVDRVLEPLNRPRPLGRSI